MIAVPCGAAISRAEPGVLTARHERGAALLAVPVISHRVILRVGQVRTGRSGATRQGQIKPWLRPDEAGL